MTDQPTSTSSNYGWALWHLEQARDATDIEVVKVHAMCANTRAMLAIVNEQGATRGVDPSGPTTWTYTERR